MSKKLKLIYSVLAIFTFWAFSPINSRAATNGSGSLASTSSTATTQTSGSNLITTVGLYFDGQTLQTASTAHPANVTYTLTVDESKITDGTYLSDTSDTNQTIANGNHLSYPYTLAVKALDSSLDLSKLPTVYLTSTYSIPKDLWSDNCNVTTTGTTAGQTVLTTKKTDSSQSRTGYLDNSTDSVSALNNQAASTTGTLTTQPKYLANGMQLTPSILLTSSKQTDSTNPTNVLAEMSGLPTETILQDLSCQLVGQTGSSSTFDPKTQTQYNVSDTTKSASRYVDYQFKVNDQSGDDLARYMDQNLTINLSATNLTGQYQFDGQSSNQINVSDSHNAQWFNGMKINADNGVTANSADGSTSPSFTINYQPDKTIDIYVLDQDAYGKNGYYNPQNLDSTTSKTLQVYYAYLGDDFYNNPHWNLTSGTVQSTATWSTKDQPAPTPETNGTLKFITQDNAGTELDGSQYTIKDAAGKLVTEDANDQPIGNNGTLTKVAGKDLTVDLPAGQYIITQTKAPVGFELAKHTQTVTVTDNQTTPVTFTNLNSPTLPQTGSALWPWLLLFGSIFSFSTLGWYLHHRARIDS